jgi:predicted transcriptional regulator
MITGTTISSLFLLSLHIYTLILHIVHLHGSIIPFYVRICCSNIDMRHRTRTEITIRILEIVNEGNSFGNGGVSKTTIMYKASLSHAQLQEYLLILTECYLLSYDGQNHTFKTTEKGLSLLKTYDRMEQIIKEREI